MSEIELAQAYSELRRDILADAEFSGERQETVFFDIWAQMAAENGDCLDLEYVPMTKDAPGGFRIDGYAIDVERGELHVATCYYHGGADMFTLNYEQVARLSIKAAMFIERCLDRDFVEALDQDSPEYHAAFQINRDQGRINRVRVVFFTNAHISMRKAVQKIDIAGMVVTFNHLDMSRYYDIDRTLGHAEPIEINLTELHGEPLPALAAHLSEASDYRSFLIAMPGELLAEAYGLYGARILEQNVRTFLQARTGTNKGIIETIEKTPEMFFAYNNGLTATASDVRLAPRKDGTIGIDAIMDLQIVNGGQTTASILYAQDEKKADLSKVTVQMKLSVLRPEMIEEVVPKISRYANTQNRISESDFFSNHPFHIEVQKVSRTLNSPRKGDASTGTKWFYERARGQYRVELSRVGAVKKRQFESEFPKSQVLTKTDVAKYAVTFEGRPDIVSQGAQKCFRHFADMIGEQWKADETRFNEAYFRRLVAMSILFQWTDVMVGKSDWYLNERGYKANIVTYTLAWLANREKRGANAAIDYEKVWELQDVPAVLQSAIRFAAPRIAAIVKSPPLKHRNISEYAKRAECWKRVAEEAIEIPVDLSKVTVSLDEERKRQDNAAKAKEIGTGMELEVMLAKMDKAERSRLEKSALEHHLLSPSSVRALEALKSGKATLTRPQINALKHLLARLAEKGVSFAAV
ncbi:MAG: hypothetical protein ACJA1L_000086 [Paracoccaceae bacterium]|jgi:hypothetical protein